MAGRPCIKGDLKKILIDEINVLKLNKISY
jgi:hypothetical protein